jgi:hypothetical protein
MFNLKFKKGGAKQRLHYQQDMFDYYNELAQQFDLIPSRQELKEAVDGMVYLVDNAVTKLLFSGSSINNYHHKEDDMMLSMTIMATLTKRRYVDMADFKSFLREIVGQINEYKIRYVKRSRHLTMTGVTFLAATPTTTFIGDLYFSFGATMLCVSIALSSMLLGKYLDRKESALLLEHLQVKSIPSTTN